MSMSMEAENMLSATDREVFACGICHHQPIEPIVTECGHIFCWRCIYQENQNTVNCRVCSHPTSLTQTYPIFIQHQEEMMKQHPGMRDPSIPSRPQASYRDKIINPGVGNSNLPAGLTHLQSNLQVRRQVAGLNYSPSIFVHAFNRIKAPEHLHPDSRQFQNYRRVAILLGIILLIILIIAVFF